VLYGTLLLPLAIMHEKEMRHC